MENVLAILRPKVRVCRMLILFCVLQISLTLVFVLIGGEEPQDGLSVAPEQDSGDICRTLFTVTRAMDEDTFRRIASVLNQELKHQKGRLNVSGFLLQENMRSISEWNYYFVVTGENNSFVNAVRRPVEATSSYSAENEAGEPPHTNNTHPPFGGSHALEEKGTTAAALKEWLAKAAKQVKNILRKRKSRSKTFTEDYYGLARLLPRLLVTLQPDTDKQTPNKRRTAENKTDKESSSKISYQISEQRRQSRLLSGVLPYVPCGIRIYDDVSSISNCVKKRLSDDRGLWVMFLGDSKMRLLFRQFLTQTEEAMGYTVHYKGVVKPWREVMRNWGNTKITKGADAEVTTPVAPRMRVSFMFRMLRALDQQEMSTELHDLKSWASGDSPAPDLLVVGYTSWSLINLILDPEAEFQPYLSAVLDDLFVSHSALVPLLEKIGERSRVIVVPQTRLRPHSHGVFPAYVNTFKNANFDWSDMMFLSLLDDLREKKSKKVLNLQEHHHRWNKEEEKELNPRSFGEAKQRESLLFSRTNDREYSYQIPLPFSRNNDVRKSSFQEQKISPVNADYKPYEKSEHFATTDRKRENFRDHLHPADNDFGLWWWDSSFPMNLAGILECEDLFQNGFQNDTIYVNPGLSCGDRQHASSTTLSDQVTMILNLLCNSVSNIDKNFCCS